MLSVLERIGGLRKNVQSVRDGIMRIRRLAQQVPDEAGFVELETASHMTGEQLNSLDRGNIHPDVFAFLKQAATNGAPLETLTPAVIAWIDQHGLRASFRICTVA